MAGSLAGAAVLCARVEELDLVSAELTSAELEPGVFVVAASGELDVWSSDSFDAELASVLARDAKTVIVDLQAVPLIDSTILGVLMRRAKQLRRREGTLVLVSNDPRTLRVIEITGLAHLFRMERSLADALRSEAA
jgi:anti-sigma B factor antagonist